MEFKFLSDIFFEKYKDCKEMEKKGNRPYASLCLIEFNNLHFAIPIRHHIKHRYAIFTNKKEGTGLDLSKTVVISDPQNYINHEKTAYISDEEFKILIKKEFFIKQKLNSYIKLYKRALKNQTNPVNKSICIYSTLQYFHKELNIE